ncbi:hypothetical protein MJO28_016848, partial [Puccinia striiformis f. sp. tritici]
PRDVVLSTHGGSTVRVTDLYSGYLALRYPIFFPFGEQGWVADAGFASGRGRKISQCEWLFQCPMNDRFPAVQRLSLHLNREQIVYYRSAENARVAFNSGRAELQLRKHDKTFEEVGLDPEDKSLWNEFESLIVDDNLAIRSMNHKYHIEMASLNFDQRTVADKVIQLLQLNSNMIAYIDGPGGTGKTFLLNCLIGHFRDKGLNIVAVASSGIAALMLSGGSTAHSKFKIPLRIESGSMCNWEPNSKFGTELAKTDVIIWDEISMQNRHAVEAVDRSFQELLGNNKSFGGLAVIFGGDFRQILPVVKGGSLLHQAKMSMLKSELWSNVVHYRLTYNVRLLGLESGNTDQEALGYNQWLLSVGEATAQVKFQEEINLPFGSVFVHRSESFLRSKVIDFVYGELIRYNEVNDEGSLAMFYMSRAILSPLNKSVNLLNEQCLNKLPGTVVLSVSSDEMVDVAQNAIPEEVLNTISIPGFPEHNLKLKINMPVVLLRNMCLGDGMCNGTRFMVIGIQRSVLRVRVLTGPAAGVLTGIPRSHNYT